MFDSFLINFGLIQQQKDLPCAKGLASLLLVYSGSGSSGRDEYPVHRVVTSSGFFFSFSPTGFVSIFVFITPPPGVEACPIVEGALA